MSLKSKNWIICYDIRDVRRLRKVYKYCKGCAISLQNSVFILSATQVELENIIEDLQTLIHSDFDDIRIYPIGNLKDAVIYGTSKLPTLLSEFMLINQ